MGSTRSKVILTAFILLVLALAAGGVMMMMLGMALFSNAAEQKRQQDLAAQMDLGGLCGSPMISADGKFANPMVGQLTSPFGPRPNPFGPGVLPPGFTSEEHLTFHHGTDIAGVPSGTPFYAATSGIVEEIGGSAAGNPIKIRDAEGNQWGYLHAADGTVVVQVGQQVEAGDQLAGAGMTGAATGVHLHLSLRQNGEYVDPLPYLAARGVTVGQGGPVPATKVAVHSTAPAPGTDEATNTPTPFRPITVPMPAGEGTSLTAQQQANAAVIIGVGREKGLPDQAIIIALMTALQETRLRNMASPAVPESLDYPHDTLGVNKASVGLFQQQHTMGWGPVESLMHPELSTHAFFEGNDAGGARGLLDYPGWETMRPGTAAQTVQLSGHPLLYHQWEATAKAILGQVEGAALTQCHGGATAEGGTKESQDQQERSGEGTQPVAIPAGVNRETLVEAARTGLDGQYVWGKAEFNSWDASGFVTWVYRDQGIQIPRTSQWTAGTRTETPQPGDLVAQKWDPDRNRWDHVGIYTGNGRMIAAVNEQAGTREYPVAQTGAAVYFDILGGQ